METKSGLLVMKAHISINNLYIKYNFEDVDQNNIRSKLVRLLPFYKKEASLSKFDRVSALHDISLEFHEGERVGFIGTNGSGKTTLLKVLSKVLFPSSGSINIQGKVNSIFDPGLGMDPEASGIENIKIRCMFLRINKNQIPEKIRYISEFSELGDALRRPIKTYSAGMSMRLAFAIATCVEPDILILDEWLSAGDARFVSKALKKMQTLIQSSRILLLASHSEHLLTEWCNRLIWIQDGRVMDDGKPDLILKKYNEFVESPS